MGEVSVLRPAGLLLLLSLLRAGVGVGAEVGAGAGDLSSCFCRLEAPGELDDCPCEAGAVDALNREIRPQLESLLEYYYFRYFQVDFTRPCQVLEGWEEGQCSNEGCTVHTCPEEQVPAALRDTQETLDLPSTNLPGPLAALLTTFPLLEPYYTWSLATLATWGLVSPPPPCSDPHPVDPAIPSSHRPLLNSFCPLDPLEQGASCQYVDLAANPERHTGYSGRAATRVWQKIYDELCFHPERDQRSFELTSDNIKSSMCLEARAFYRVVSGLHASISVHISSHYSLGQGRWGRSEHEFGRRFSPATTDGEGPERLQNLYFLYLLELRALVKAAPVLQQLQFGSGDAEEDERMKTALSSILQRARGFPGLLDETAMFKSGDGQDLLTAFKDNFRSISLLMDCLGCERCKVWGKLQITGLGTALKILFAEPGHIGLSRHELVALVNAFGRISTSIQELQNFRDLTPGLK